MKRYGYLFALVLIISLQACFDPAKPNYQYFPNMYEPVGYKTYADTDAFANGIEAQVPVEAVSYTHLTLPTNREV